MRKFALAYVLAVQAFGVSALMAPANAEAVSSAVAGPEELDPAHLVAPILRFTPSSQDVLDYDKFFYFHRADTSFSEAYADIKECDALASGVSFYNGGQSAAMAATASYGVAGAAIGGAISSVLVDAIFGSAERRRLKRISQRNCMGFKGYSRYGLSEDLWKKFNFEEGLGRKREGVRGEALQLQAVVASGPKPDGKELGL